MSTKPLAHQVVPGARGPESASAEEGAVRSRDSLFHWCGTVDAIRVSTNRADKRSILDAYFETVAEESAEPAARFFLGVIFPSQEAENRRIEWPIVAEAIQALTRLSLDDIRGRYRESGDLGAVAADAFAGRLPSGISVSEVAGWSDELARAPDAHVQRRLIGELLARLSSLEALYVVKLMVGELDIALDAADVEAALATRYASERPRRGIDRRKQNLPRSGGADQPQRRRRRTS
jgi:DNA ligase-like protein